MNCARDLWDVHMQLCLEPLLKRLQKVQDTWGVCKHCTGVGAAGTDVCFIPKLMALMLEHFLP